MEDWLLLQNGIWLYVTIFVALLGGAFGLPIPEDLPLLISGVLIHQGRADGAKLYVVCYIAVLLGDLIIYRIGRGLGPALFTRRWFRRRVSHSKIKKLRVNLNKRTFLMIVLARHLFYLRTVTFLVCGAVKMDFIKFLIADMLAAVLSVTIMIGLGYLGAEHFEAIVDQISSLRRNFVIASLVVIGVIYYFYRRRSKRSSEASETTYSDEPEENGSEDVAEQSDQ